MICKNCQREINHEFVCCPYCAQPTAGAPSQQPAAGTKRRTLPVIAAVCAVVFLAGGGICFALRDRLFGKDEEASSQSAQADKEKDEKNNAKEEVTEEEATAAEESSTEAPTEAETDPPHYVRFLEEGINQQMLACYYWSAIQLYVDYYGEETLRTSYGLDISLPLDEQPSAADPTKTWHEMILDNVLPVIAEQQAICWAASEEGYELSDDERNDILEHAETFDLERIGNGVTEEDLCKVLTFQRIAVSYHDYLKEKMTLTDEELEDYFEENRLQFLTCTVGGVSLSWAPDESGNVTMTKDTATDLRLQFENCSNAEEFEEMVKTVLVDYRGYTAEEVEAAMPTLYNDNYTYVEGNALSEWAFNGAEENEIFSIENTDSYFVYIMKKAPERDDSHTVNVRHILFMGQEDNMASAEAALEEWQSGEATEESFGDMAEERSEDPGSNTNGGLYEAVTQGQMVEAFDEWCFDETRQPGDTGIVETEYGVHVMYFSGHEDPAWKLEAFNAMWDALYPDWLEEQMEQYPIEIDDALIESLES